MSKSDTERIAIVETKIDQVLKELKNIRVDMHQGRVSDDSKYVSKDEFKPVRMLAYGAASILLTAVLTAIMYMVLTI